MNTFRALKHMLLLAVVLCSLSAVAQSKYDRWGGVYYAYHAPEDAKLTPAPGASVLSISRTMAGTVRAGCPPTAVMSG